LEDRVVEGSLGREERRARRKNRKERRKERRSGRKERRQERRSKRKSKQFTATTGPVAINPLSNPVVSVSVDEAQTIIDQSSALLSNLPPREIASFDKQITAERVAIGPVAADFNPVVAAARDDNAASEFGLVKGILLTTAIVGGGFLLFKQVDLGDLL